MKYIDAEKLKERIKKLDMESCISEEWSGFYYAIDSVLEVIDSLQQEQPEVGLEKETNRWWKEHLHLNPENKLWMDAHQSVVFARHFYELGLKAKEENK